MNINAVPTWQLLVRNRPATKRSQGVGDRTIATRVTIGIRRHGSP
jgi:hypothetical protein